MEALIWRVWTAVPVRESLEGSVHVTRIPHINQTNKTCGRCNIIIIIQVSVSKLKIKHSI